MKRNLWKKAALAMAGCMSFMYLLSGCGSSSQQSAQQSTTAAASAETTAAAASSNTGAGGGGGSTGGYRIACVVAILDEYLTTLEKGVENSAAAHGVDLQVFYGGPDSNQIIRCVESAKNLGFQAAIVTTAQAEDAEACIEAADGMPLVFLNRDPAEGTVLPDNAAVVISNENESGAFQGEFLAKYFKDKGQNDVRYVMLQGTPGMNHTRLRTEGALNKLKEGGINAIEATPDIMGDYDRQTARAALAELLPALQFDCIISNNDAMALGAVQAMKEAGMDPTSTVIVGIDATRDGVTALKNDEIKMTVFQDAAGQAETSMRVAMNMVDGKPFNEGTGYDIESDGHTIYVPFVAVTKDNVDEVVQY